MKIELGELDNHKLCQTILNVIKEKITVMIQNWF